jgi:hypothetical protein
MKFPSANIRHCIAQINHRLPTMADWAPDLLLVGSLVEEIQVRRVYEGERNRDVTHKATSLRR